MTEAIALLRSEPRARVFFAVLAQSSLGTGAAYVGLLVVAYERFHSPWAISLVLLADFVPSMLLGPLLGAIADRWSRRWCAVAADGIRAVAFIGIGVVGSFPATVGLALAAGIGTALFRPAALAALPSLVGKGRSAAATSLYGAITDFGHTVGPAVAAALLAAVGPEDLLVANGATFAVSGAVLSRLSFGDVVTSDEPADAAPSSLFRETREGLRSTMGMPGIRIVIATAAGAMFFGGAFNVAELPFATTDLGTTPSGYSILVAVFGLGFVGGSLRGAAGGDAPVLKRRFLDGILLTGAGGLVAGAAPNLALAVAGFAVGGFGNGLLVVHQRLLFLSQVRPALQGRVFAVADGFVSWGFALAYVSAGGLAALVGARFLILLTGAGHLLLAGGSAFALRRHWTAAGEHFTGRRDLALENQLESRGGVRSGGGVLGHRGALAHLNAREEGEHLVGHTGFWLTLLDDLKEGGDDVRVELGSGVRR
jgi:MFS family permease